MSERGYATEPTFIAPTAWNGTDVILNTPVYPKLEFQVGSLSGGPFIPQRRLDATLPWDNCVVYDQHGKGYSKITASEVGKIFKVEGASLFQLAPTNVLTDVIATFIRGSLT